MKHIILTLLLIAVPSQAATLLFESGFESATTITELTATKGFNYWHPTGTDAGTGDNWITTLDAIDYTRVSVDGGLYGNFDNTWSTHELAEIVADPDDAGNDVMHFIVNDVPYIDTYYNSARLSAALMFNKTGTLFTEGYVKYRMRFGEGFAALEDFNSQVDWLVISEIFEHDSEDDQTWRCSFSIHKAIGVGESIYWNLTTQDGPSGSWTTQWTESNTTVAVPDQTWFTLEMFYRKGNASGGRFYAAITPDGGSKQVLFDVINFTHGSSSADNYTGDWAVFKLYASGGTAHEVSDNGTPLEIWYDDFEYWDTRPDTLIYGGKTF